VTPSIVLEYIMLLCSRSKLQVPLGRYMETAKDSPQWSTLESTLTLVVNGFSSLPTIQGPSVVTFVWISSGIIVASTIFALVSTPESSLPLPDEESQPKSGESSNLNMDQFHN